MHRTFGETLLVGGSGVAFRFLRCVPAEDAHKLVRSRAVVSGNGRACLPQSVGGAMRQSGLIAPAPKFVAETGSRKGPAEIVHQEREIAAWRSIDDLLQRRKDRQRQLLRLSLAALVLRECDLGLRNVLASESDHIRTPLPREQEQRHRETGLGAYRMAFLKLPDLIHRPSVEAY